MTNKKLICLMIFVAFFIGSKSYAFHDPNFPLEFKISPARISDLHLRPVGFELGTSFETGHIRLTQPGTQDRWHLGLTNKWLLGGFYWEISDFLLFRTTLGLGKNLVRGAEINAPRLDPTYTFKIKPEVWVLMNFLLMRAYFDYSYAHASISDAFNEEFEYFRYIYGGELGIPLAVYGGFIVPILAMSLTDMNAVYRNNGTGTNFEGFQYPFGFAPGVRMFLGPIELAILCRILDYRDGVTADFTFRF